MNQVNKFLLSWKELQKPIQYVKGVGPNLSKKFSEKGINTIFDALHFFPIRYEDRRNITSVAKLTPGMKQIFMGEVLVSGEVGYRKKIFEAVIGDATGIITAKWFNYHPAYMRKIYRKGQRLVLFGEVRIFGGKRVIIHPEIEIVSDKEDPERDSLNFNRIVPVYSEIEGVYPKVLRRIMKRITDEYADMFIEPDCDGMFKRLNLLPLREAIRRIHFPNDSDDVDRLNRFESAPHRRLVFDELFFLELGLAYRKKGYARGNSKPMTGGDAFVNRFLKMLPFRLTPAQERVLDEICSDMRKPHPMHRLLQGDVGSGKTVVAFIAGLVAIASGCQVALMAPTEILAEQHYRRFKKWLDELNISTGLLTGDVVRGERERILNDIESGKINMVIGTHALIQESVRFRELGLAIIDEQHRFGVLQRAMLQRKGLHPHVLVMTATPIPRTLSMTLYGDLDLSVIDGMPPGRKPVLTRVSRASDRGSVYNRVKEAACNGEQAYIVYPLIEESPKLELNAAKQMYSELREKVFSELRLGLLHGRMTPLEKEQVMEAFSKGEMDVLVSTTVIEVGIDIPNATLMVIEHAERFGLSQLHQLRGRVRRSDRQAECILIVYGRPSEDAYRRLRVMAQTDDGFRIAEEDLRIRGPGDFVGTRQSGLPDFRIANIMRDERILADARREAFRIIESDTELSMPANQLLKVMLAEHWRDRLELARVG